MRTLHEDNSIIGQWWWEVDRWQLFCIILLCVIGVFLILSAGPPAAERMNIASSQFVTKHLIFLPLGVVIMLFVSGLSMHNLFRIALILFIVSVIGLVLTLANGVEVKGSTRWLRVFGFTVQPSEFMKPALAIVMAWFFSSQRLGTLRHGYLIATCLYIMVVMLFMLQPDFGQSFLITLVWAVQLFLIGLPMVAVLALAMIGGLGTLLAYFYISHVRSRIDRFINPASGDTFQIDKSVDAFKSGGLMGVGPGEGSVKYQLPDGHADFIFAVAAEEYGIILCFIMLILFIIILMRATMRAMRLDNLFAILVTAGLIVQFGVQSLINMGSTLNLIPTKGMTLPFISYGGSSILATSIAMGVVLSITRRRLR